MKPEAGNTDPAAAVREIRELIDRL